jgi:phosphomannomutase
MRSDKEIKQAIIAILTAVDAAAGDEKTLAELLGSQGFAEYSISNVSGTVTADDRIAIESIAESAAKQVAEQVEHQTMAGIAYSLSLFRLLAAEFGNLCPGLDVQEFLRRQALKLAEE